MTDFGICLTCPEVTTGRLDSSKGWLLDASSNHNNCEVVPFANLTSLPPPIRNVILRLGASVPISDTAITMLKLGLNLEDQWTPRPSIAPAAENTSRPRPVAAPESDASTRSRRASTPISATPAPSEPSLLDLLKESA